MALLGPDGNPIQKDKPKEQLGKNEVLMHVELDSPQIPIPQQDVQGLLGITQTLVMFTKRLGLRGLKIDFQDNMSDIAIKAGQQPQLKLMFKFTQEESVDDVQIVEDDEPELPKELREKLDAKLDELVAKVEGKQQALKVSHRGNTLVDQSEKEDKTNTGNGEV
jgi:hypothetical protein